MKSRSNFLISIFTLGLYLLPFSLSANPSLTGTTAVGISVGASDLSSGAGSDLDSVYALSEQTLNLANVTGNWTVNLRKDTDTVVSNFAIQYRVDSASTATVDQGSVGVWYTVNDVDTQILSGTVTPGPITISYQVSSLTLADEVPGSPTINLVYTLSDQSP